MGDNPGVPPEKALTELSEDELDTRHRPVHRAYPGLPVRAWIRSDHGVEHVYGEVMAWTAKAVQVTWQEGRQTHKTWVRRDALTNRPTA